MEQVKILSLFNGMSCGAIALDMLNIEYEYYYSEIDKYANKLTASLYPNAIALGDVRNIDVSKLPYIDVLIGGSPCQSFSFAGKRKGMATKCEIEILKLDQYLELKENNFEFEGQSYLFWEYIRILRDIQEYNPDVKFLLENVIMVEKWRKVISQNIGIPPIQINAALVSAQNRDRNFWTNIKAEQQGLFGDLKCMIPQPKDRGILLRDILEKDVDEKYYLSEKVQRQFKINNKSSNIIGTTKPDYRTIGQRDEVYGVNGKMGCLNATDYKQPKQILQLNQSTESKGKQPYQQNRVYDPNGLSPALCRDKSDLLICHNVQMMVKVRKNEVDIIGIQNLLKSHKNISIKQISEALNCEKTKVEHWFRVDKYFAIPDAEYWFELKKLLNIDNTQFDSQITEFIEKPNEFDMSNRAYDVSGKNPTLTTSGDSSMIVLGADFRIRRLTPRECLRLQSVPENVIDKIMQIGISYSQLYKMAGNGWNCEVIKHIFSYLQWSK